jgi:hypothetical protein
MEASALLKYSENSEMKGKGKGKGKVVSVDAMNACGKWRFKSTDS